MRCSGISLISGCLWLKWFLNWSLCSNKLSIAGANSISKCHFTTIIKSNCGDKTTLRLSCPHIGFSYIGKMTSFYWIRTPAGGRPNIKISSYQYRIPVLTRRRSRDCLIFNIGITTPENTVFILRRGPGLFTHLSLQHLKCTLNISRTLFYPKPNYWLFIARETRGVVCVFIVA